MSEERLDKTTSRSQLAALVEMYQHDHHGEMPGFAELMMMREAIASVGLSRDEEVGTHEVASVEVMGDGAYTAVRPSGAETDDDG